MWTPEPTPTSTTVKEGLGQAPEKWMADAAKEITAAGEEVIHVIELPLAAIFCFFTQPKSC